MAILVYDNYDSFTWNLVHYLEKCTHEPVVVRTNDSISVDEAAMFDRILISPGPGLPQESGNLMELLDKLASEKKILGVCLGLQAITLHFGGKLRQPERVFHGVATPVRLMLPDPLFENIPNRFKAGRYHSWIADEFTLPDVLEVTAIDDEGMVMALRHKLFPVHAVQFHPESILTEHGEKIMANWIAS